MIEKYLRYIDHCFQDAPANVMVGMSLLFCVGTVVLLVTMGKEKGLKCSAGLLLLEYLVLLLIMSVWARTVMAERKFDFTPFWSYRAILAGRKHLLTQDIMNVAAFIPIGLLLGCAFGRLKWWQALLIGGGFSVLIEALQFVLRRGFAEFDDVFHNEIGCVIGWGVYAGIAWLWAVLRLRRQVQ